MRQNEAMCGKSALRPELGIQHEDRSVGSRSFPLADCARDCVAYGPTCDTPQLPPHLYTVWGISDVDHEPATILDDMCGMLWWYVLF